MFLYTNKHGQDVMCHGTDDMRKADGVNIDLRQMVVHDEEGQLIGIQGGSMSLQKSMPLIKAMRDEQLLMKAKPVVTKKSETPLRKSFGQSSFESGLANLNRKMAEIRSMQHA